MVRHDTHYEPRFFKVVGLVGKSTISGQSLVERIFKQRIVASFFFLRRKILAIHLYLTRNFTNYSALLIFIFFLLLFFFSFIFCICIKREQQ